MSKARLKRAKRLSVVVGRLRKAAEGEMSGLRGAAAQLQKEQIQLRHAFDDVEALQGLLVPVMARRMRSLSRKIVAGDAALGRQQEKLVDLKGLETSLQRDVSAREAGERRKMAEVELLEIIDACLAAKKTSLR